MRKDLLQKVKRYDGKLSNVLHIFQVCHAFAILFPRLIRRMQATLNLDTWFALLAKRLGVRLSNLTQRPSIDVLDR